MQDRAERMKIKLEEERQQELEMSKNKINAKSKLLIKRKYVSSSYCLFIGMLIFFLF
jgi:hypothetical protein